MIADTDKQIVAYCEIDGEQYEHYMETREQAQRFVDALKNAGYTAAFRVWVHCELCGALLEDDETHYVGKIGDEKDIAKYWKEICGECMDKYTSMKNALINQLGEHFFEQIRAGAAGVKITWIMER